MKKRQLQKILNKPYIRIPVGGIWPQTKYVRKPEVIPDIPWEKMKSEEDVGNFLLEHCRVKGTQIVGKMKVNLQLIDGEYVALRGDVLALSWWKNGVEDVAFEDLQALKNDDDDLASYPIQLSAELRRTTGEWDFNAVMTDDLTVYTAIVLSGSV